MVPQGLGFWSHWIFRLWLCWWSCGSQVNIWHMPFPRMIFGQLVLEETELRITVYYWSWVYYCWFLLCSIAMDEANSQGLWHPPEACATLLWQRKRHQDCQQSSSSLEDKAHSDSSSFSSRSCVEERHLFWSCETEEQLADIFTKPLDEKRFSKLRCELNILESSNVLWKGHSS